MLNTLGNSDVNSSNHVHQQTGTFSSNVSFRGADTVKNVFDIHFDAVWNGWKEHCRTYLYSGQAEVRIWDGCVRIVDLSLALIGGKKCPVYEFQYDPFKPGNTADFLEFLSELGDEGDYRAVVSYARQQTADENFLGQSVKSYPWGNLVKTYFAASKVFSPFALHRLLPLTAELTKRLHLSQLIRLLGNGQFERLECDLGWQQDQESDLSNHSHTALLLVRELVESGGRETWLTLAEDGRVMFGQNRHLTHSCVPVLSNRFHNCI